MATKVMLKHRDSGIIKNGYFGFSWTTFFFGFFPPLFRGDYLTFVGLFVVLGILTLLTWFTFGLATWVAMFVWAFLYNKYYTRKLLERGYMFADTDAIVTQAKISVGVAG